MSLAVLVVLLFVAGLLAVTGLRRGKNLYVSAGILAGAAVLLLFSALSVWGEVLWFASLGYAERFWKVLGAEATCATAGALFGVLWVTTLTIPLDARKRRARGYAVAAGGVIGGFWGLGNWETILKFLNPTPTASRSLQRRRCLTRRPRGDSGGGLRCPHGFRGSVRSITSEMRRKR